MGSGGGGDGDGGDSDGVIGEEVVAIVAAVRRKRERTLVFACFEREDPSHHTS